MHRKLNSTTVFYFCVVLLSCITVLYYCLVLPSCITVLYYCLVHSEAQSCEHGTLVKHRLALLHYCAVNSEAWSCEESTIVHDMAHCCITALHQIDLNISNVLVNTHNSHSHFKRNRTVDVPCCKTLICTTSFSAL